MQRTSRADVTLSLPLQDQAVCFRRARFVITPPAGEPREVSIELPEVRVGTDPDNEVVVDDPHVSRRHCEIRQTKTGFLVHDLGSTNGVFAAGLAVREAVLPPGSSITVGQTLIQLLADEAQPLISPSTADRFGDVIGASPLMRRIFGLLERVAPTDLTVTFIGDTGTGKELFARAIHERSPRARGPFEVIDCSAVASGLVESELFGHEKGAFTGADKARAGAFERAGGGTVFLDEIGELPLDLQPKLLRALEQRVVKPVGGSREIPFDVRIVAATHRRLDVEVSEGRFREDLFFRLSVIIVGIPPLGERPEDIPLLARRMVEQRGKPITLADDALEALQHHDWPGNVRELRNVLESSLAVLDGPVLRAHDLLFFRRPRGEGEPEAKAISAALPLAGMNLADLEREAIVQTLRQCGGNKTAAARALGIASSTLYEKLKKYKLG
jgi:DNA-binding NtrC family response regulator